MAYLKHLAILLIVTALSACGGARSTMPPPYQAPDTPSQEAKPQASPPEPTKRDVDDSPTKPGGYYLDDGPEENPPSNLDEIPDATPKLEPLNPRNSKPYQALGQRFTPMTSYQPFKQSGIASWYGKRFHGKKTASGDTYNMYAMSAAHPTLPLPSYVKVTNPSNNRTVIVRVNDRGPFKHNRIIDLSYAAAHKLRIVSSGSALVNIEAVDVQAYLAEKKQTTETSSEPSDNVLSSTENIEQFFVQVGAFKFETNANGLKQKLQKLGIADNTQINHVYNKQLHRLKLGPYLSKAKAQLVAAEIRKQLNISSIINTQ
jgi:rare lipoprotein A